MTRLENRGKTKPRFGPDLTPNKNSRAVSPDDDMLQSPTSNRSVTFSRGNEERSQ